MREISSSDNELFKTWKKLKQKKYRQALGLFVIEETNLIADAVAEGWEFSAIVVDETRLDQFFQTFPELVRSPLLFSLPHKLYKELSDTECSRGWLGVVKADGGSQKGSGGLRAEGCYLCLDRLQDPGNVGTLIRSADAAGFAGVIVIKGTCDIYSSKVLRSTAGSIFRIPCLFMDSAQEVADKMHQQGISLVVSTLAEATDYTQTDLSGRVCIVVGNEGRGVDESFMEAADLKVKIPMASQCESLNAAVAGSILMFEQVRQRTKACHR